MIRASQKSDVKRRLPRVLVVGPSLDILGGQSVQAERLLARLRKSPQLAVDFLPINPRLPGVFRSLQKVTYVRTLVTSVAYIFSLLLRVPKYDVLHIFSASYLSFVIAPTPAILIGRLFGKKLLLNYHSGEAEDHFQRWPSAIATLRLVDQIVVPSNYLVRVFQKYGMRARSINNLVELENFSFRERAALKPRFLSNRNLEKHYGVDHILRAFAVIQKQIPEASLTVAGDGAQRSFLEKLAQELSLQNTKFVGQVKQQEITRLYEEADVYLNASEIDNQPLSILEAFACGLPVITTAAGGIPDMVTDGLNGFVVKCGDHQALAEKAISVLGDSKLTKTIVGNALGECGQFSWETVGDSWVELYSQLAQKESHKSQPIGRFAKLRHMSFAELRGRSAQAAAVIAERRGWSGMAKLPTDTAFIRSLIRPDGGSFSAVEELFDAFRERTSHSFATFADPAKTIAVFRSRWPEAEKEIIAQADRILAGHFDLLGFNDLDFGDPIDWQLEPVSGKSAPRVHWSRLNYLDPELVGDKKITWELNRHQYFVKLGQAYWLTGDEKYAATFVAHLESWMDQNPPKLGINWASSLEIAFRSISWLWALEFFRRSPSLKPQLYVRVLKFLFLNARHLETYLSTYFSPNTHLTGEALGLFYLGTFLPQFKEAPRWKKLGQQILIEQLSRQVHEDGVYFEQSSYYQRYTADFYTHLLVLSQLNNESLPVEVVQTLQALLDHLMYITRPDGTMPLFGDDDGGRLLFLDRRATNDFRAALSNGAVLFKRGDYKYVAGELAEETFWLLGPAAVEEFVQLEAKQPEHESKAFPAGGYYVMRDGWSARANYLLFDCGPHGTANAGHAHADALAVEVAANGHPALIDPGTFTYTGSGKLRDWFRSSSAHNTLTVDSESSSIPCGPFSWKTMADGESKSWLDDKRFSYAEGSHNGYQSLSAPVTHDRAILFLKHDYWVMRDRITSTSEHSVDLNFHFSPESIPDTQQTGGFKTVCKSGSKLGLQLFTVGSKGHWSEEEAPVSHCYGSKVNAPVCVFSAQIKGSTDLVTLLLPRPAGAESQIEVNEVEAIGGCAVEITSDRYRDFVVVRGAENNLVETVRIVSDFSWTWARFDKQRDGALVELVVMDGQRLQIDGKEILTSTKPAAYAVATRAGEGFRLETAEGAIDLNLPVHDLESLFTRAERPMEV